MNETKIQNVQDFSDFRERFHIWRIFRDIVIFTILGIICGYIIDKIVPQLKKDERITTTILLIFFQILLCSFIAVLVLYFYEKYVKYDPNFYLGESVFLIVLFVSQIQIYDRIGIIYEYGGEDIKSKL